MRRTVNPDEWHEAALQAWSRLMPHDREPDNTRAITNTLAEQRLPTPLVAARNYRIIGKTHVECRDCGHATRIGSIANLSHAKNCKWSLNYPRMEISDRDICPYCNRQNHTLYNTPYCEGFRRYIEEAFANIAAVSVGTPSEDALI